MPRTKKKTVQQKQNKKAKRMMNKVKAEFAKEKADMAVVANAVARIPSRGKLEDSKVYKTLANWIKKYIIVGSETPALPSPFREFVQVHNLPLNVPIPVRYRTEQGYYAMMTQPDLEKFLRIATPGKQTASTKDPSERFATDHKVDSGLTPAGTFLSVDKSWTMTDSEELVQITLPLNAGVAGAYHWSTNKKTWIQGCKAFHVGSVIEFDKPSYTIFNSADHQLTFRVDVHFLDANMNLLSSSSSDELAVSGGRPAQLGVSDVSWSGMSPHFNVVRYITYGLVITNSGNPLPEMKSELACTINFNPRAVFADVLVWESRSLWECITTDPEQIIPLRAQYNRASHVRFGLYDMTIKNATAPIAKGGLIASAQVPGGENHSAILRNPDDLYPWLSCLPHDASGPMDFEMGQHYFYIPEKLQDWMFKPITTNQVQKDFLRLDIPKIITAIYSPQSLSGTTAIINLVGYAHYEFLTTDLSTVQFKCPGDSLQQITKLLQSMRSVPQFTENPKHLKAIGDAIMSVVKSPLFKKTAMELGTLGLEMLLV